MYIRKNINEKIMVNFKNALLKNRPKFFNIKG